MPADSKLVGMQRWICEVVEQGVPVRFVILACHLGVVLWTVIALAAIFFSFHWILWLPLLLIVAAACTLYVLLVRNGYAVARNPDVELEWYQQVFWDGMLFLARRRKWSDGNRADSEIIDLRRSKVSDQQLIATPGLKGCKVLDLEGCRITDQSLKTIQSLKSLQCLVLRGSNVSHSAIVRLQQRNPKVWVWY